MRKNKIRDKHHLLGQEYREYFNINDPRNIKYMQQVKHRAIHTLMQNLNTPKDQLAYLKELFDPILSDVSQQLFTDLLSQTDQEFYADGIVKNNTIKYL